MIHYVERLIYPSVHSLVIQIPTTLIAVFTVIVFLFRPPEKIKKVLEILFNGNQFDRNGKNIHGRIGSG